MFASQKQVAGRKTYRVINLYSTVVKEWLQEKKSNLGTTNLRIG